MKYISEINTTLAKGYFPQFISDLYKNRCQVCNVQLISGRSNNNSTLRMVTCTAATVNVAVTGVLSFMPFLTSTAFNPKLNAASKA